MDCGTPPIPMDVRTATQTLLSVRNLKTYFPQDEGTVKAVDGVTFDLYPGATLGIVGESGCGKSVTARSILRIVDRPGRIVDGEIHFRRPTTNGGAGQTVDLTKLEPNGPEMRAIRGAEIALIFQEPMSSFSPVHSVGNQIIEAIRLHRQVDRREGREQAIGVLPRGGGPPPGQRGGQPALQPRGGPPPPAKNEPAPVDEISHAPRHPYTQALLRSIPRIRSTPGARLASIAGSVPHPYNRPPGCPFHPRCSAFMPGVCDRRTPRLQSVGDRHQVS